MNYRPATASDAAAIAEIHADSWRRNYRGAYLDSYLDGDVASERLAVWTARLSRPEEGWITLVADRGGVVVGFVHTSLDEHPKWGAFLENLHVTNDLKRHGIGRRLMIATARAVAEMRPASGLYLWVLEQNAAAQAFYEAIGGERIERQLRGPFPGGGTAPGLRYAWPETAQLLQLDR
jgi:ribosomal protein S18 acetylase RimI-like enzyme